MDSAEKKILVDVKLGENARIWNFVNLFGCEIGKNTVVSCFVEIQSGAKIGDDCKIESFAFIPPGVTIGNRVFIGPHVCFTNDKHPRAVNPDGTRKSAKDWQLGLTVVEDGAAIGANSTIVCGVKIGKDSMVGAGSVVTKDVPPGCLVVGNPAKVVGKANF